MFGKTRRRVTRADDTYYACVTKREHHKTQPWYDLHPGALTLREDAIDPFFHERVFGPHRLTYLEGPIDEPIRSNHEATAAAFAKRLDELDAADKNLILFLQQMTSTGDPEIDASGAPNCKPSSAENTKRKRALAAELEALTKTIRQPAHSPAGHRRPLPQVGLDVLDLPDELQRQLFDAFQLEIRYDRHRRHVTIKVAIRAEISDSIGQATARHSGAPERVQSLALGSLDSNDLQAPGELRLPGR